jgi:hypothetical protein
MGGSMSKEYMTTIMILDPPEGIKPGLTAEAKIAVNEISDALLVPVQSVFSHGGKTYSLIFRDNKWDKVEVKIGPSNDKEVVIQEGLKEGEPVVLGAWSHRENVDLPKINEEENGKGGSNPEGRPDGKRRQGQRSEGGSTVGSGTVGGTSTPAKRDNTGSDGISVPAGGSSERSTGGTKEKPAAERERPAATPQGKLRE